jgi:hypothetical protein
LSESIFGKKVLLKGDGNVLAFPDERSEMIRQIEDSFSNIIQLSQRPVCVSSRPFPECQGFRSHTYVRIIEDFAAACPSATVDMQKAARRKEIGSFAGRRRRVALDVLCRNAWRGRMSVRCIKRGQEAD